jgi:hypothetical protein
MPKPRTLRVYANPYTFIDHEGRPAGVYPHDAEHRAGASHVGLSKVDATTLEKRDPKWDTRNDLVDVLHTYDAEVQEVPDIPGKPHYRQGIREGSLIPADEATAKAVGMKWEEPAAVLERARLKAIQDWTANHGEPPAFAVDDEAHAHVPELLGGPKRKAPAADPAPTDDAARAARRSEENR